MGAIVKKPGLEVFEHVAKLYSEGWPLYKISEGFEFVPSPMVLHRWRHEFPVFASLMADAASVRAERLVEECLEIADDENRGAAAARNAIGVRERLADRLAGPAPSAPGANSADNAPGFDPESMTTEQLFAYLHKRGAIIDVGEDEYTKISSDGGGYTPPEQSDPPVPVREADSLTPESNPGETLGEEKDTNGSSGVSVFRGEWSEADLIDRIDPDGEAREAAAKLAPAGMEGDMGEDWWEAFDER